MSDQRMTRVLTGLHELLWSALVALLVIALTFADSTHAPDVLKLQLIISVMMLVGGACVLRWREAARRCWVRIGQLARLSDDDRHASPALRVTRLGRWAVLTGCAIGVVAFLRFCKDIGWGFQAVDELYSYHYFVPYIGRWLLVTAVALAVVATTLAVARRSALRR